MNTADRIREILVELLTVKEFEIVETIIGGLRNDVIIDMIALPIRSTEERFLKGILMYLSPTV